MLPPTADLVVPAAPTPLALMPHQHEGIEFLIDRRACLLAFEQGLGKTLVAIAAFQKLLAAGDAERMLVVCPNSLKRNWAAELAKFAPELDWTIVEGAARARRQMFLNARARVVITSYETARAEVTAILALVGRGRTVLVLDESHAAKNRASATTAAAKHFAPRCDFRWLLSGTPVTNSPDDLYTQIEIIAPGERPLGSRESFLFDMQEGPPARREELRRRAAPFIMRRTKEQCLDLPDKSFVDLRIELPEWQRSLYNDMRDDMVCEIRSMTGEQYRAFASTALARLTRLVQLATNPALLLPDEKRTPAKLDELDNLLRELLSEDGRKVIVWSNFVGTIEAMLERYKEYGAVALYGGTPGPERQDLASRFQNDPHTRVLIGNPAAAGTGFTLTAAAYTVYESFSWRYDHYAQSQDRNHRIGQSLPVTYMRLVAADTIEEAICRALERKSAMARDLLGDDEPGNSVSELSRDEMVALLMNNTLPNG